MNWRLCLPSVPVEQAHVMVRNINVMHRYITRQAVRDRADDDGAAAGARRLTR